MTDRIPFRGPHVWHHTKTLMGLWLILVLAGMAVVIALGISGELSLAGTVVLTVPALPLFWGLTVSPRLVLLDETAELVHVTLMPARYRIEDVVNAVPGYWGLSITLANGDVISASTLQKPNYAFWFGLTTRSDRAAHAILSAAAEARGEEPPPAPRGKRGPGDPISGFRIGMSGLN